VNRPRATDTRAGVSVHLGRADNWALPEPRPPRSRTSTSIIGRGSRKFHTGEALDMKFTDVLATEQYALTCLFGGEAMDSETGKSFVGVLMRGKLLGWDGITDSTTEGVCAQTVADNVITIHSHIRHGSVSMKARAMRDDLLSCCSDKVRPKVAAYNKNGPWLGLLQHFLQTCGPQDMRSAVSQMLSEAKQERPLRTLRQRVTTLVESWNTAQDTFYGVQPEIKEGSRLEPCACSPFISIHEQADALKQLVINTDKSLWQVYSNKPEYRDIKDNHVPLLQFILDLHQEAWLSWWTRLTLEQPS